MRELLELGIIGVGNVQFRGYFKSCENRYRDYNHDVGRLGV